MRCDRRLSSLLAIGEGAIGWGEPLSSGVYPGDVIAMSVCGGLLVVLFSFALWGFVGRV